MLFELRLYGFWCRGTKTSVAEDLDWAADPDWQAPGYHLCRLAPEPPAVRPTAGAKTEHLVNEGLVQLDGIIAMDDNSPRTGATHSECMD